MIFFLDFLFQEIQILKQDVNKEMGKIIEEGI
jgi:hypothetical protein